MNNYFSRAFYSLLFAATGLVALDGDADEGRQFAGVFRSVAHHRIDDYSPFWTCGAALGALGFSFKVVAFELSQRGGTTHIRDRRRFLYPVGRGREMVVSVTSFGTLEPAETGVERFQMHSFDVSNFGIVPLGFRQNSFSAADSVPCWSDYVTQTIPLLRDSILALKPKSKFEIRAQKPRAEIGLNKDWLAVEFEDKEIMHQLHPLFGWFRGVDVRFRLKDQKGFLDPFPEAPSVRFEDLKKLGPSLRNAITSLLQEGERHGQRGWSSKQSLSVKVSNSTSQRQLDALGITPGMHKFGNVYAPAWSLEEIAEKVADPAVVSIVVDNSNNY